MGIFSKINFGLSKTRNKMNNAIDDMLDSFDGFEDDLYTELEEILVMGDVGVNTAVQVVEELKERVKAEGKTARGAHNFVFEVARIVNGGKSCHIDPATVYAIVMHYFEDVPAMGRFEPAIRKREEAKAAEERKAKAATEAAKPKKTPEEKKADAKAKRKARALKKKAEEEAKARAEEERKRKEAERRERAREEAAVAKIKAEKDHGQMFLFELI